MSIDAARLNDQLCFALYSASNRLTAIYRSTLEPLGLTYPQFVVMMALWETDGVSITQLAIHTNLSKATMTPLLKKLESKCLIQLGRIPGNDRQKKVELTECGRALASKSVSATKDVFCATGLTLEEAKSVINTCQKITT